MLGGIRALVPSQSFLPSVTCACCPLASSTHCCCFSYLTDHSMRLAVGRGAHGGGGGVEGGWDCILGQFQLLRLPVVT